MADRESALADIQAGLKELDEEVVKAKADEALANGVLPLQVIEEGLSPAMKEIGDLFERGELFLPELLVATEVFKAGLEVVRPSLAAGSWEKACTVVIGTVEGDVHDIGKNIVKMMLETAGFEVIDLGIDVKASAFLDAAKQSDAKIIAASSLLSSTLPNLRLLVEAVRSDGLGALVMIGGAPVTDDLATAYGADGFAPDAILAVEEAKRLSVRV